MFPNCSGLRGPHNLTRLEAISKPLFDQSKLLILNGVKRVLKPALDIHYIHSREGDGVRALGDAPSSHMDDFAVIRPSESFQSAP